MANSATQQQLGGLSNDVFVLAFASWLVDVSIEMLNPVLPVFLTQTPEGKQQHRRRWFVQYHRRLGANAYRASVSAMSAVAPSPTRAEGVSHLRSECSRLQFAHGFMPNLRGPH
jgi:hypothetical protein